MQGHERVVMVVLAALTRTWRDAVLLVKPEKYMRSARGPRPWGQSWSTFLKNHGSQVWACDFLQTYDIFFRPIFAFFIVELGSREAMHVGVTRLPTRAWTAQQLREATPLDHVIILSERHMLRVLKEHVAHFNRGRPHQGIGQRVPAGPVASTMPSESGRVVAHPVLGGLHHDYRWAV